MKTPGDSLGLLLGPLPGLVLGLPRVGMPLHFARFACDGRGTPVGHGSIQDAMWDPRWDILGTPDGTSLGPQK